MHRQPVRSPLNGNCISGPVGTHCTRRVRQLGALVLCLVISLLALPAAGVADPLAGTVVGKDGNPRPFVRVDIIGPRKVVIVADDNGRFAVDVPPGRYKVRVTDSRRRMEFDARSPSQGQKFRLSW